MGSTVSSKLALGTWVFCLHPSSRQVYVYGVNGVHSLELSIMLKESVAVLVTTAWSVYH